MSLTENLNKAINDIQVKFRDGLSNTSTKKFNDLSSVISEIVGLPADDIYITSVVARASNTWNRLSQGKPLSRHFSLGVCIASPDGVDGVLAPLRNFIGSGNVHYDSIAVVAQDADSVWKIKAIATNAKDDVSIRCQDQYGDAIIKLVNVVENPNQNVINRAINPEEAKNRKALDDTKPLDTFSLPWNLIFFGAPGTGKSFQLNENAKIFGSNVERVTFYPNYSYAQFVGTYKPITSGGDIAYAYVPGPFMRQWIRAKQNSNIPVLLIVEELNRANAPAVFGDMFQLLDRKDGVSEYPVATGEDLRKYLKSILSDNHKAMDGHADWEWLPQDTKIDSIVLPANLFIWTTMNSADQGVFPLDTAFKRRWDNTYIGIDEKQDIIAGCNFHFGGGVYNWNEFRKKINDLLAASRVNEDKLLGPFFLNPLGLSDKQFIDKFKSKVLMYLYEDAARQCRNNIFVEDENKKARTYSKICEAFDKEGASIFKGMDLPSVASNEDNDENLNIDQKNEMHEFREYLQGQTNLAEDTRRGYTSAVSTTLKILKEEGISLEKALEDDSVVFSVIDKRYGNGGTQKNYHTSWGVFAEFKRCHAMGAAE